MDLENHLFIPRCKDYRLQTDIQSVLHGYAYACPKHTHNLYLEILIAGGILGFVTFVVAIMTKFFILIKNLLLKKKSCYAIGSILLSAFLL